MSKQTNSSTEQSRSVPQLRFPEFDGDWEKKKLGEVAEKINSGKTPLGGESVYSESGILFIRSQNVNDDKLSFENPTYISEEINNTMKNSVVKPNDILLNITGASLGRSCVVPNDFNIGNVNQHVCIIRLNKETNPRFVQPILSSTKGQNIFFSLQTGSGREGLNFESIKGIEFSFPSLPEQTKIASFLTVVDEKIQALKKKHSLLEQYKKGVMQGLFCQNQDFEDLQMNRIEDDNNPEILKSSKSRFRQLRFKDENGKDFPEWGVKKLGEVGETYGGLSGKSKENFGIGKLYIQYKQIFDDSKIDITRFELVDIRENENQNKVQFGDVFFTVSSETPNEIGMSSVLLDIVEELYLNSFCFGFRANSLEELNPFFSRYLFRSESFREEIIKLAQGSTRYNMSKLQLLKIEIKLPCLDEQTLIANFLSALDEKINQTQMQIQKTEVWKKGLLQKMFV